MHRSQYIVRGIVLIIAAVFVLSVQDVVFKLFSTDFSLWQLFALRGLLAVLILIILEILSGNQFDGLSQALKFWPLLRSLFLTMSLLAFYAALPFLSLSIVGAANYIAPIIVTLLSALIIGEPVKIRAWIGVFTGFAGVIILLQPSADAFSPWIILPMIGAIFYAFTHIITHAKCQFASLKSMAISLNLMMAMAGFLISGLVLFLQPNKELSYAYPYFLGGWSSITLLGWAVIALLAGLAVMSSIMLAGAYQAASPAIVAPFEYSYLAFAAIWDILFFGIFLDSISALGIVLIIVAGLLVLRR